jgi:F-box protein 9
LAYRRSCGINIKRYNGTLPVRDFNRGLNTLVFVPWEHAADHVLNNSAEEMDFFVTG